MDVTKETARADKAKKKYHKKYFTIQTEREVGEKFTASVASAQAKLYVSASRVFRHFLSLPDEQRKAILAGM
jgi:beta-galactosidase beta subunit